MIDKLPYGFINSVYGFNDYTLNELICKLAQKMDEVITQSNESFNYLDWLKEQGLPDELQGILNTMLEDGTFENIINQNVFNGLNNRINEVNSQLDNNAKQMINNADSARVIAHFILLCNFIVYPRLKATGEHFPRPQELRISARQPMKTFFRRAENRKDERKSSCRKGRRKSRLYVFRS